MNDDMIVPIGDSARVVVTGGKVYRCRSSSWSGDTRWIFYRNWNDRTKVLVSNYKAKIDSSGMSGDGEVLEVNVVT